jgi:hypothetical protein
MLTDYENNDFAFNRLYDIIIRVFILVASFHGALKPTTLAPLEMVFFYAQFSVPSLLRFFSRRLFIPISDFSLFGSFFVLLSVISVVFTDALVILFTPFPLVSSLQF